MTVEMEHMILSRQKGFDSFGCYPAFCASSSQQRTVNDNPTSTCARRTNEFDRKSKSSSVSGNNKNCSVGYMKEASKTFPTNLKMSHTQQQQQQPPWPAS